MPFSAQNYLQDTDPPTYVDRRGREHVGRVVSYEEWLPLQQRIMALAKTRGQIDGQKGAPVWHMVNDAVVDLCDTLFPEPWYRRILPWRTNPVTRDVLSLPPMGMLKAAWSFMESVADALGQEMARPEDLKDADVLPLKLVEDSA